jgi:hypothetical protein
MTKKKFIRMSISLSFLMMLLIFMIGCEINQTKSSSGSSTGSSSTTENQPAHGQDTINLMEKDVFSGEKLNASYWTQLEGYCKAGPTKLIIADMALIPDQMSRSGFSGRWGVQMYALASTYAGVDWKPGGVEDLQWFYENQDRLHAWYDRYIMAVLNIMQKAPQTTALIVINDEPDRLGARLGYAIQRNLASVGNRAELGQVLDHWR